MKRKGGEQASEGAPQPISPFQEAINGVNSALFAGEYNGDALRASVAVLVDRISTGVKKGDVLELAGRCATGVTLTTQAASIARSHGETDLADVFTQKSEGLGNIASMLQTPSESQPKTPPASRMADPKK